MKKLIYGGVLLATVGLGSLGCKKISEPDLRDNPTSKMSLKSSNLNFEIKSNLLVFNSWEDIMLMVDNL